ncbi:hypothetical protein AB0C77_08300 [Streptomyces sp. NPDC048629]|uniref:hypothetical protein n=1 Tax=Streptomyces sp. NPDC048629 TaxID=3154824 RepID=UPI0034368F1E
MGKNGRVVRTGAVAAALVSGVTFGAVAGGPSLSAVASPAAGLPAECAEVRDAVERLEGDITPNACAFMRRQITFGEIPTGTPPQAGEVTHPRVQAYLDIFDPEATLWEAGSAPQRGHGVIGTSIIGSLGLVPDLRYAGTDVVADGAVVMFGQWNEATIKGHKVSYPQIARNVLSDDGKSIQARRYYDRVTVFGPAAPELRNLFDGVADPAHSPGDIPEAVQPARFAAAEITDRLAAWNDEDATALTERMRGGRLNGPGLATPLTTAEGQADYLNRLFAHGRFELKAGQAAFGRTTAYVEWHGTVTTLANEKVSFGIVERFGPDGEWELTFDTLPLVADQAAIRTLYQRLAQP